MMQSGHLDRRITIETLTVSRDSYGGKVETWAELASVWAQATPWQGREAVAADQVVARAEMRFKIRYRADFDAKARIQYEGQAWDIIRIDEISRREGLFVWAKRP
jgi:SPP1 family predicted phage head-tail adaptor